MKADRFEICIDWAGATHQVGTLHASARGESVVFEYLPEWLDSTASFAIDPTNLPLRPGPFHAPRLPGALADAGPDRWGRLLIERSVRLGVLDRKPYRDFDFLVAIDDTARIGALRIRRPREKGFLGAGSGSIPPVIRLRELLAAADAVHDDRATSRDLAFLLGAGSPVGGARPKCLVSLPDGRLAIAKFSKSDDTRDIPAGEILALAVARAAGIDVADHQLVTIDGRGVALVTRFDRRGSVRVPFVSATTILGLLPDDPGSYTRLADAIRAYGDDVPADLAELWRRLVFSALVGNVDDHMRNHGFLMSAPEAWSLSPAYDINPTPQIQQTARSKTPVSEDSPPSPDPRAAIEDALAHAERFGLRPAAARGVLDEVRAAVRQWRSLGQRLGLSAAILASYAEAFEDRSAPGHLAE